MPRQDDMQEQDEICMEHAVSSLGDVCTKQKYRAWDDMLLVINDTEIHHDRKDEVF